MRTCSRDADNNFAKMRSRGHVPVGRLRLIEGEYLIDYRLNAARRYRTAHRLEHLHRADRDALHVGATGKDQSRIEFSGRAAQAADHTDLAADTDGAERAGKRRGAADLDTKSTPRPRVNPSAAFSQSGVVL